MKIKLLNTANQRLPIYSGGISFVLTLRLIDGNLYATVEDDDKVVVGSHRVIEGADIFTYRHLQNTYGRLVMRSKYGAKITDFSAYNSSVYLDYRPPKNV